MQEVAWLVHMDSSLLFVSDAVILLVFEMVAYDV